MEWRVRGAEDASEAARAGDGGALPRLAPALVFALAFALYAATRRGGTFSDAVQLAERVSEGPAPYYNVLYLPLGWAFHRSLAPLLGWDAWSALSWLSVVAGAAAVALCWSLLRDVTRSSAARAAWCGLFALAPGTWFFATSVEVHAVQLACVSAATLVAWRARAAPSARVPFLVAAALAIAVLGHLSTVLLLPALVLLASGDAPGRGHAPRPLSWRALLSAVTLLAIAALTIRFLFEHFGAGRKGPFAMLGFFWSFLLLRVQDGGLFSSGEVLAYLQRELAGPAGVLLLALPVALVPRDRRLALAVALALAPYLLVLPQGGLREHGAYYVSLLPILVLGAARALETRAVPRAAVILGLALVPQAVLGARAVLADGGGEDARVWAAEVRRALPTGSVLYTSNLPRWHAAAYAQPGFVQVVDVWRVFELSPVSVWNSVALGFVQHAQAFHAQGQRIFVDADLFGAADDLPEGIRRLARALEAAFPVRSPVPADAPLVLELSTE